MYLNKRIVQAVIKKIPPIGVTGPNHFKLIFMIDCNERKKILKEKRKVPIIKNPSIQSISSNDKRGNINNIRPWYIKYLIPTSKDCNADSGRIFFNKCAPKAPKITDSKEKVIPKISEMYNIINKITKKTYTV
tara:strand:- start:5245 stop:5643 length:399 start_codon:yes stop_codon:yes gene_type:complete